MLEWQFLSIKGWVEIFKMRLFSKFLHSRVDKYYSKTSLAKELADIAPDLPTKTQMLHAFQMNLVVQAMQYINCVDHECTVATIGDSHGVHTNYLNSLEFFKKKPVSCVSVNLDAAAMARVTKRGQRALMRTAEELQHIGVNPKLFIAFGVLECLLSPITFLRSLAIHTAADYFVVTMPFCKHSKVTLDFSHSNHANDAPLEQQSIFSFSVKDWQRICLFSGWEVVQQDIYSHGATQGFFANLGARLSGASSPGTLGLILKKNLQISNKYQAWPNEQHSIHNAPKVAPENDNQLMKKYCFDIDGTICTNTNGKYESAELLPGVKESINRLYEQGNIIYLHTARGGTTGIDWRELTEIQMKKWGIKYHQLFMGKPPGDVYIDDKALLADTWHQDLSLLEKESGNDD